jgi:hypothetical protein
MCLDYEVLLDFGVPSAKPTPYLLRIRLKLTKS